jgi:hypothetical protein
MGIPSQGDFPAQTMNPMFPTPQPSQQQYMGGPPGFTMSSQHVYGPTNTSIPHPYYQYSQPK